MSKVSGNILKSSGPAPCYATVDFCLSQQPGVGAESHHLSLTPHKQTSALPQTSQYERENRFILAAPLFRAHNFHQIILPMDTNTAYSE